MSSSDDATRGDENGAQLLRGNVEMPALGLGVFEIPDGPEATQAVRWALEAGYRHIDTAQAYGNEHSVGNGLRDSGVSRHQVFITTKFAPGRGRDPEEEAERSLLRLGLGQLDLYLVHSPRGGPTKAWPGMERALEQGLTRSIGVSNFGVDEIAKVVGSCSTPPAVNQIQLSPFQFRRDLLEACREHGIVAEAYSPLTRGRELDDAVITTVARRNGRTAAQVMLRWGLQRGLAVIPKSARRKRIEENLGALGFSLSEADMAELDLLDRTGGTGRAVERSWWTRRARARAALERVRP